MDSLALFISIAENLAVSLDSLTASCTDRTSCRKCLLRFPKAALIKAALVLPEYQSCLPSVLKSKLKGDIVDALCQGLVPSTSNPTSSSSTSLLLPNNSQLPQSKPPSDHSSSSSSQFRDLDFHNPAPPSRKPADGAAVASSEPNEEACKPQKEADYLVRQQAWMDKKPSSSSSTLTSASPSVSAPPSTFPSAVSSSSSSLHAVGAARQHSTSKNAAPAFLQDMPSSKKLVHHSKPGLQSSSSQAKQPRPPLPVSSSSSSSGPSAGNSRPMASFFMPMAQQNTTLQDPRLNNEKKRKIFRALYCSSGIRSEEVISAIDAIDEDDLSEDIVLAHIISHREGAAAYQHLAALKVLEDAQYDQAVLESEKERDNIEMRKRRRKEELLNQLEMRIQSAEEFRQSVWLHGLTHELPAPSTSTATGASADVAKVESEPIALGDSILGCGVMQLLAYTFDSCDNEENLHAACLQAISGSASSVVLEYPSFSDLMPVRKVVVDLLMLEGQMLRYYKDESHPFLLYLANKIDNHVVCTDMRRLIHLHRHTITSRMTGTPRNRTVVKDTLCALQSLVSSVLHVLCSEKYLLERGLAKIPTGGCRIPDLLRYKRLRPFMEVLRPKVDADGFEFVEGVDGLELLSDTDADVEEILSDSDDDDDDDDDDNDD